MKINDRDLSKFNVEIKIGGQNRQPSDKLIKGSCYDPSTHIIHLKNTPSRNYAFTYKGFIYSLLEHEYLHAILEAIGLRKASIDFDNISVYLWNHKKKTCSHAIRSFIIMFEPEMEREK